MQARAHGNKRFRKAANNIVKLELQGQPPISTKTKLYTIANTNADFASDLVVEGVILELQSLSLLLKIF